MTAYEQGQSFGGVIDVLEAIGVARRMAVAVGTKPAELSESVYHSKTSVPK